MPQVSAVRSQFLAAISSIHQIIAFRPLITACGKCPQSRWQRLRQLLSRPTSLPQIGEPSRERLFVRHAFPHCNPGSPLQGPIHPDPFNQRCCRTQSGNWISFSSLGVSASHSSFHSGISSCWNIFHRCIARARCAVFILGVDGCFDNSQLVSNGRPLPLFFTPIKSKILLGFGAFAGAASVF